MSGAASASPRYKYTVAVDLDEVLGGFLPALTQWHNRVYGTTFSVDDYRSYSYCDLWGGSNADSVAKVHEFFQASEFATGVRPIAGAVRTLRSLLDRARFVVVTSRQHVIAEQTRDWIERHFAGIFAGIEMGNHYDLASPNPDDMTLAGAAGGSVKRSKPDMCADVGAVALIDDSVKYACQCATACCDGDGPFLTILFGEYGWNTGDHVPQIADGTLQSLIDDGKVIRVATWEGEGVGMKEVLTRHLDSLDKQRQQKQIH